MRLSYLMLIPVVCALVALGIPKRFGYFHDALISVFAFLAFALLTWLFEQKQAGAWPFRRRYTGR